jgi:hypothetical protein
MLGAGHFQRFPIFSRSRCSGSSEEKLDRFFRQDELALVDVTKVFA